MTVFTRSQHCLNVMLGKIHLQGVSPVATDWDGQCKGGGCRGGGIVIISADWDGQCKGGGCRGGGIVISM